jgi:diguanylate cyclase (GGDEF)-like protein
VVSLPDSKKGLRSPLLRNTLLALLLWTGAVGGSLLWNIHTLHQKNLDLAKTAALSDMAFGIWAAAHGGIYVSPDGNTPPNSHPTGAPNRDLVTTEGKRLTAIDPTYLQHQVIGENTLLLGAKGRITSLQLANPINQPDEWEKAALESFRQGAKEVTTVADINGETQFRVIHPLVMGKDCLKCHATTGVNLGEVRGGISVSIPMEPIYTASRPQVRNITLFHGAAWLLGMGFIWFVALVNERESVARQRTEQVEELAGRDSLTGLYNHGKFYSLLNEEIVRSQRYNHLVSLLMLDIDYFKRVNDIHGHQAGDAILQRLSDLLLKQARIIDRVCRYGGEEITVILPETDAPVAMNIAERLRGAVERRLFEIGGGKTAGITVSIGVATYPKHVNSLEDLVKAADLALYAAKRGGRNRTCLYEPEMAEENASA